jgi:uncharacterized protein
VINVGAPMSQARPSGLSAPAAVALLTVAVAAGMHFAFRLERAGAPSFWGLAIGPTLAVALVAAVWARGQGELGVWLRPVWGDFTRGVVGAALLFGVSYYVAHAWAGTPRESWLARLYLQCGDPASLRERTLLALAAVVTAAASEEIVWRGLVPSLLEPWIGARWAYPAAALPYAAATLPTLWALRDPEAGLNPLLPLAAIGGGLVWGEMARRFHGRLMPSIIAHTFFAWLVLMTFRLWGPSV